jgi:CheY-like chemotaxis protein/glycine cleavage system H lipoate-binding protein
MSEHDETRGGELTILVVDDEQVVLDSARKLLRKDPLAVVTAKSAAEGLERLERGGVHVVLTDMMMPGMDGLEFTRRIKERWPSLPVVMITGYATISTAMQAMKLGAFDYIAKPFTKAELRGIVKRALHLVAEVEQDTPTGDAAGSVAGADTREPAGLRTLGGNSWLMVEDDGRVRIGVERAFVSAVGAIQDIDLPNVGDVLKQGAICLQIVSGDLRSHNVWSPLSGEVVEVNPQLAADPNAALQDPYGDGWLLRIRPSNFENERRVLGL